MDLELKTRVLLSGIALRVTKTHQGVGRGRSVPIDERDQVTILVPARKNPGLWHGGTVPGVISTPIVSMLGDAESLSIQTRSGGCYLISKE